MPTIKFKATRKSARSCDSYREIVKSGDLKFDSNKDSDDLITINKKISQLIIDCDKKTGEFSLKFTVCEDESQKIDIPLSESDLEDLRNGDSFQWRFPSDKGEEIDVHIYQGEDNE